MSHPLILISLSPKCKGQGKNPLLTKKKQICFTRVQRAKSSQICLLGKQTATQVQSFKTTATTPSNPKSLKRHTIPTINAYEQKKLKFSQGQHHPKRLQQLMTYPWRRKQDRKRIWIKLLAKIVVIQLLDTIRAQ